MIAKVLPKDITAYDLIKSLAVIIMIIDHTGAYFFPDDLWWRAVGRIGFPVWFFLVGYSSGRDIPTKLWGGAVILLIANALTGWPIVPFNALVTIIVLRLIIDPVMKFSLASETRLWLVSALLFILILPTYFVVEYGTQALITAMFGYMVRHKKQINENLVINFMVFALLSFVIMQAIIFGFSTAQFAFITVGTLIIRTTLLYFDGRPYPELTKKMPGFITWLLQFGGRRTLEIYVAHLVIFKFATVLLGMEGHEFFTLKLM